MRHSIACITFVTATILVATPLSASAAKKEAAKKETTKEANKETTKEVTNKETTKETTKEVTNTTTPQDSQTTADKIKTDSQTAADKIKAERSDLAAKNLKATETFLEDNKKKSGIITTASGLQYKILKEGKGKKPGATSFVTVNYKGTLADGTVFDSSAQGPVTFAVNAVIPGWTEALQLMNEGSKWIVYIPPQLAYGEKGVGRIIGPNQLLIFEIDLVDTDEGISEDFKEKKVESFEDAD